MKCLLLVVGALSTVLLAGCQSTTRIEAKDSRVVLPSIRGSINITPGSDAPSEPRDGQAIELEISRAKGSGPQSLAAGQAPVLLEGKTFTSPQQLNNGFDLWSGGVSWRWRKFFGNGDIGLETLAGVGQTGLDLTVSSPSQTANRHFTTNGVQGGVGLIWRVQPGASVQARFARFFSLTEGVRQSDRYELFFVKSIGENMTARIGYNVWEVSGDNLSNISDFRLRFSGPALGLEFHFGK